MQRFWAPKFALSFGTVCPLCRRQGKLTANSSHYFLDATLFGDGQATLQQGGSYSFSLPWITDNDGEFGLLLVALRYDSSNTQHGFFRFGYRKRHKCNMTVVINLGKPGQHAEKLHHKPNLRRPSHPCAKQQPGLPPEVMKTIHNVALIFIRFLFR